MSKFISTGLSINEIGLVVIGAAVLVLAVILTIVFVRRRSRRHCAVDDEKDPRIWQMQLTESYHPDIQGSKAPAGGVFRAVSRHNLSPSITLPAHPLPTARPRPPKLSGRTLSSIMVRNQTASPMPHPLGPHGFARRTPAQCSDKPTSVHSGSFSRSSILSTLRSSFRSSTASSTAGTALLKVRNVFSPLLPDELVLRLHEKVTLIQMYDDGWCIVGRKSPLHTLGPSPSKSHGYAFGKAMTANEVEVGAVPSWVFEKHDKGASLERPMRSSSLGVTLVLDEGRPGVREEVISWSNL